jgi:hypothetical protein
MSPKAGKLGWECWGLLFVLVVSLSSSAWGQGKKALRVKLINGTTRQPVPQGELILLQAGDQGMKAVRTLRTDAAGQRRNPQGGSGTSPADSRRADAAQPRSA